MPVDRIGIKPNFQSKTAVINNNPSVADPDRVDLTCPNSKANCIDMDEIKKVMEQAGKKQKEWTVIFYMDGNNDLEPEITTSMLDLEKIGSNENVNLVVQLGRLAQEKLKIVRKEYGGEYQKTDIDGDWSGSRRYFVFRDPSPTGKNIYSPALMNLGEKELYKPQELADFVIWAMQNFKSKNYLVVLMDHGGGWIGAFMDDSTSSRNIMKPQDMSEAFSLVKTATHSVPDVIHMNACLMANTETAFEMRKSGRFYVGSEEMGEVEAFKYDEIVSTLQEKLNNGGQFSPEDMAKFLVEYYSKHTKAFKTISAIDLQKMENVKNNLKKLSKALVNTKTSLTVLKDLINNSQNFSRCCENVFYSFYKDLYDIAKRISNHPNIKDEKLQETADDLMKSIDDAVIANFAGTYTRDEVLDKSKSTDGKEDVTTKKVSQVKYDCHGLSIYAPTKPIFKMDDNSYSDLSISNETMWDEFLVKLNAA